MVSLLVLLESTLVTLTILIEIQPQCSNSGMKNPNCALLIILFK